MRLVVLDFETHYSADYSLSKMSPLEYVRDPRFQLISCSIKVDDHPTDVFFGHDRIAGVFSKLGPIVKDAVVIAHNMSGFDAYVCAYVLGLRPKLWGCTLAMARPIHAKTVGLGLAALVKYYQKDLEAMGIAGVKDGSVLVQTRGKRLEDFTPSELEAMRTYNRNDTDQCWGLFKLLRKHYTPAELWQIDALIRMRTEPQFELDVPLLETAASVERSRKHAALIELATSLRKMPAASAVSKYGAAAELAEPDGPPPIDWSDEEAVAESVRSELASAPKFSALLERLGVEVPMKPSPTNPEKLVPALAKTDEAFTALQDHENPLVAAAARARLGVKSTLLETRIGKFLTAGRLAGGRLPVPLRYCGADTTGRDSGEEYNPQNQPRIDPDKPKVSDALRKSLRAPKGKKVIVADQSGIELRVNHFLWKVPSSMELYQASPDKADLYRAFAAGSLFKVKPEEISKSQRQLGKMCILEGTLVLTRRGEIPIEQVRTSDLVWDGVGWVPTDGPIFKGVKDVIHYDGLAATTDHDVWIEDGRKVPFGLAAAQSLRLARTGAGRVPMGFGGTGEPGDFAGQRVQVRQSALYGLRDGEGDLVHQPTVQGYDVSADSGAVGAPVVQAQGRVWDLLNCGPRNRFTAGGRLVSNCQLGLGFGAGGPAFQRVARTMGGIRLHLNRKEYDGPELTAEEVVSTWRETYAPIVQGWRSCARGVLWIADGAEHAVDPWELVHTCSEGFVLPSGRLIRYPDLREEDDGEWPDGRKRRSWFYGRGRHKARITGPKACENIVQALARDSIFDCSVEYFKQTGLRPALRVHDELVYVVDEGVADELLVNLQAIMRQPPKWWPQLVVWSEGDSADTYGDAK